MKKSDLSDDARDILDEIEDMSRCNATNGTTREVIVRPSTGETVTVTLPWAAALAVRERTSAAQAESVAARLFARYGATLEEIAQMTERGRRSFVLKLRHGKRAKKTPTARTQEHALTEALALRDEMNARVSSPSDVEFVARATHRAVHRALTGEDTRGCKWCEEATR